MRQYRLVVVLFVVFTLIACSGEKTSAEELNLMTWGGDFIPREVINDFEKKTGIKVNYKEVSSNEEMQSLLETSPNLYDLAVVTDYMVDILRQNSNIKPLDHSQIPNISNINSNYQGNYYDEQDAYSIPYAVSTAVLLANPKKLSELSIETIDSYNDLWNLDLKNEVVIIDGAVEVMGIVSKALSYEVNDPDEEVVNRVRDKLFELRPNIVRFETNTPEDSILNEEASIGFMYSNQAAKAINENPQLMPIFAKEGIPIYIDSFVMSNQAPNENNAYLFLDFILDGEVSAKISETTQFTSVNTAAKDYLSQEFLDNPLLNMNDEVSSNTFFYVGVEDVLEIYDFIYSEFKMQ